MRRYRNDLICLALIAGLIILFFVRLFFPVPQLIVTPDFGRSDAWHFSFATKYALSQSLKSGTLPLWRSDIGDGFPLLAEGQTGTFFLPNLILFSLLPVVPAYNIALILTIAMLCMGTYLVGRLLKLSPAASLLSGITFGFSGLPILQLTHITLLQGMSMMPVILACTILLVEYGAFPWMGVLALLLTQQVFAGFPQATILTLILAGSYIVFRAYKTRSLTYVIIFGIAVALGAIGGSAQILPSWEFLRASINPSGFSFAQATQYSMPLKHLASFIMPYVFGNPKLGTYPPFSTFDGSIFWENTAYIGIIPLCYILIAWIKKYRSPAVLFFTALTIVSVLLAWGKSSPLYIFFTFWPLNLFRAPSRFLWITAFSAALLSAFGLDTLSRTKSVLLRCMIVTTLIMAVVQLLSTWYSYHLLTPSSSLLTPKNTGMYSYPGRYFTVGMIGNHNSYYIPSGWKNPAPYVSLYTQGLSPDANILYHVSQHDVYAGRFLYRMTIADSLLNDPFPLNAKEATVSSVTMLSLFGIHTIVSYIPIDSASMGLKAVTHTDSGDIRVYDNPAALPRAYLAYEATTASTLTEAAARLFAPDFVPGQRVVLETRDVRASQTLRTFVNSGSRHITSPAVQMVTNTPMDLQFEADAGQTDALFVLTDTYYPGWVATIDTVKTEIYPANIKQRVIVIPSGMHTVHFHYEPESVRTGLTISILTELVVVLLMVAPLGGFRSDIAKKARQSVKHRRRSPDR